MSSNTIMARRRWAYSQIRKADSPPPSYGSAEWLALSDEDPRKLASVAIAAEAWARDGDDIETRLRRELANRQHGDKRAEDLEYHRQMHVHRASWRVLRGGGLAHVPPSARRLEDDWSGGDAS